MKFSEVPKPRISFLCSVNKLPAEYQNGDSYDPNKPLYQGIRVNKNGKIYYFNPPNIVTDQMTNIPHLVTDTAGTLDLSEGPEEFMFQLPYYSNGRFFLEGEVASKKAKLYSEELDQWYEFTVDDLVVGNKTDDFIKDFNVVGFIESEKGFLRINTDSTKWTPASDLGTVSESTDGDGYSQVCITDPDTLEETCYYFYENETYLDQNNNPNLNDELNSGDFVRKSGSYYRYEDATLTMSDHTVDDVMDSIQYRVYVNDIDSRSEWGLIDPIDFLSNGDTFTELQPGQILYFNDTFWMLAKIPDTGTPYYKSVIDNTIQIDETSELWGERNEVYQLIFKDADQNYKPNGDDVYIECPSSETDIVMILNTLKDDLDSKKDDNEQNFLNYITGTVDSTNEELILTADKNQHNQWQYFQIQVATNMIAEYEEVVE